MTPIGWIGIGLVALAVIVALAQIIDIRRKYDQIPAGDDELLGIVRRLTNEVGTVERSLAALERRMSALEATFPTTLRRSAVVMYDAYPGMVGSLSRSVAMLDDNGDGFVISVLVNRDETRFFLKGVHEGSGVEPLSPEEVTAVGEALRR